jgi:hypothetical protein
VSTRCWSSRAIRSHQSAESRISVSRLRCRFRDATMATAVATIRTSPAPTMISSDAQLLGAQNFRITKEVAIAMAKSKSFTVSRRHCEHEIRGARPLTAGTPRKRMKGYFSRQNTAGDVIRKFDSISRDAKEVFEVFCFCRSGAGRK